MFAVDDGLLSGNYNLADVLFLIAAIVFAIAVLLPFLRRGRAADGTRGPIAVSVEQIAAVGLCLVAIAWLVL